MIDVILNQPEPTITLKLPSGMGNVNLSPTQFSDLHDKMTTIYNKNFDLIQSYDEKI